MHKVVFPCRCLLVKWKVETFFPTLSSRDNLIHQIVYQCRILHDTIMIMRTGELNRFFDENTFSYKPVMDVKCKGKVGKILFLCKLKPIRPLLNKVYASLSVTLWHFMSKWGWHVVVTQLPLDFLDDDWVYFSAVVVVKVPEQYDLHRDAGW